VGEYSAGTGKNTVTKQTVQALIRAGAFDALEPNRATLFASMADGIAYMAKLTKKTTAGSILPELPKKKKVVKKVTEVVVPILTPMPPWTDLEQLEQEKLAVGFYFSGHPFDGYRQKMGGLQAAIPLSQVDSIEDFPPIILLRVSLLYKNSYSSKIGTENGVC